MSNIELLNQLLNLTVWLPIKDYSNYEISICGKVRNFKTKRILKNHFNNTGYCFIGLCKNNQEIKHYIHRLVAEHFIPNLDNDKCVDHINNVKTDNTVSNLRWCTFSENQCNRKIGTSNKSSIKGVFWNNNKKKWHAKIMINKKQIHIGYF